VVVLDVSSGEVLAMVNQPAYNPNDREQLSPKVYRNRAVTDIFEPGSSIKPFIVAAGLSSGKYTDRSVIDTSPGFIKIGDRIVRDEHGSLGRANIATLLAQSSNVGMALIATSLEPEQMWSTLDNLGFGQVTSSGFPGESAGLLTSYSHWRPVGIASMSRGYGMAVTAMQLAHGYATVGALGVRRPVSFLRVDAPVLGDRVIETEYCRELLSLLESVVTAERATGHRAAIPGYRVSGKTGTAYKTNSGGGYSDDRYVAVFGGIAPVTNPRLATVIVIDEPKGKGEEHQGGYASAPVFSEIVGGALRLMAVAPDEIVGERDDLRPMQASNDRPEARALR
jgi:cell division protein FtsI (penicillin-binding protein 3)